MRIPVSPFLIGESGQHGVSGDHAVSAQVLGGIKCLIRLPKKPVGTNIAAGNVRYHADAERYPRPGSSSAMSYPEIHNGIAKSLSNLAGAFTVVFLR